MPEAIGSTLRSSTKIGVIGCGYIFRAFYSPILQSLDDRLQVACVCDLNPSVAQWAAKKHPGARPYSSAQKMLEREDLDAVLVLTKETANAANAAAALARKAAVYVEKPPAVSVAEWQWLSEQEEQSGSFVFTAFNRRRDCTESRDR